MNHSYRVTAGTEEYVLRIYDKHRDLHQVSEEVRLLNTIKHIVSVSYPIANARNEFIGEINAPEGNRCAVLFSFAKGKKVRNLTAALSHQIGTEVARFHQSAQNIVIERQDYYAAGTLTNWAYGQLSEYISSELEEMKFIKTLSGILPGVFSKPSLTRGVVHLDIWYDNMAIRDDGTITLFDFDNCGNGWLVLDIGYYCMQLFYTEPEGSGYEQKKAAFLDGYRSVMPITDAELELVPYAGLVIWIYYLGVQAQRFDSFGNFFLSENYFRMMVSRVRGWLTYNNIHL